MENSSPISSAQNPWVRKVLSLRVKSRERRKSGLFVLEGDREIRMAQMGGYAVQRLFLCPDILSPADREALREAVGGTAEVTLVSGSVYSKMAYRGNTQGVLAIARAKDHSLGHLELKSRYPLILVAEAPEKPGNIGALLRTADAAALDAVIIANPKTDLYNPNTIRSSVGCLFTTPVGTGSTAEVISYLKARQCRMYCASLSASIPYTQADFTGNTAIIVGTEDQGLSEDWLRESDRNIIIPMSGHIDSMNVSVSAAILIFEARRQRELQR